MDWNLWIPGLEALRKWRKRLRVRDCNHGLHKWTTERVLTAEGKPSRFLLHRCKHCTARYTTTGHIPHAR